jgi:formylglycine-generating enzyme required for sulfatase activity
MNWLLPLGSILLVGVVVIAGVLVFWQSGGLAFLLAPTETEAPTETATGESIESEASPTPTEAAPVAKTGYTPVTRNADWTPVIQDFGGVQMALVPAGCFQMGTNSGDDDEKPVHRVCFDAPFWLDVLEVSQAQFAQWGGEAEMTSFYIGENLPRERITWTEADAFCKKRNLRLPTEAEWEYAARGPDGLVYPWGNEFIANNAVYSGTGGSIAQEVGGLPAGASWVGALDLSGNVWEWVNDRFTETYYATLADEVVNPKGPETGSLRVSKGGSMLDNAVGVSVAKRIGWLWYFRAENGSGGFRCAGDTHD